MNRFSQYFSINFKLKSTRSSINRQFVERFDFDLQKLTFLWFVGRFSFLKNSGTFLWRKRIWKERKETEIIKLVLPFSLEINDEIILLLRLSDKQPFQFCQFLCNIFECSIQYPLHKNHLSFIDHSLLFQIKNNKLLLNLSNISQRLIAINRKYPDKFFPPFPLLALHQIVKHNINLSKSQIKVVLQPLHQPLLSDHSISLDPRFNSFFIDRVE